MKINAGKNNYVYLLVGQRGSGKSHYAEKILKNQPGVSIVSRDEILVRLAGSADTSPYAGAHYFARKIMLRLLRRKLSTHTGLRLILDSWTGESRERKSLIEKLREYGASRVAALYFITPLEKVNVWFWQKPGIAKVSEMKTRQGQGLAFFSEDAPASDYEIFHALAAQIGSDGFDEVVKINPQEALAVLH